MTTPDGKADLILSRLLIKDLRIQCRQRQLSPAGGKSDLVERVKEHMLSTSDFSLYNEDGSKMGDSQSAQLFGLSSIGTGNNYSRPSGQNVGNFLGARPSSRVLAAPGGKDSVTFGDGSCPEPSAAPRTAHEATPQEPVEHDEPQERSAAQVQEDKKASFLTAMTAKIAGNSKDVPQYSGGASKSPLPLAKQQPERMPSPTKAQVDPENASATTNAPPSQNGTHENNYSRPSGQNVGNFLTDKPSSRVLAPPGGKSSFRLG